MNSNVNLTYKQFKDKFALLISPENELWQRRAQQLQAEGRNLQWPEINKVCQISAQTKANWLSGTIIPRPDAIAALYSALIDYARDVVNLDDLSIEDFTDSRDRDVFASKLGLTKTQAQLIVDRNRYSQKPLLESFYYSEDAAEQDFSDLGGLYFAFHLASDHSCVLRSVVRIRYPLNLKKHQTTIRCKVHVPKVGTDAVFEYDGHVRRLNNHLYWVLEQRATGGIYKDFAFVISETEFPSQGIYASAGQGQRIPYWSPIAFVFVSSANPSEKDISAHMASAKRGTFKECADVLDKKTADSVRRNLMENFTKQTPQSLSNIFNENFN